MSGLAPSRLSPTRLRRVRGSCARPKRLTPWTRWARTSASIAGAAKVMRILPRLHEEINEEWITDKTRFIWDGLRTQRLDRPYVRKEGRLQPCSWTEAFETIASKIKSTKPEKVGAIAGDLVCVESMMALRDLMGKLRSPNLDCRQEGSLISNEQRANYLFNTTIQGLEDGDAVLLVGTKSARRSAACKCALAEASSAGTSEGSARLVRLQTFGTVLSGWARDLRPCKRSLMALMSSPRSSVPQKGRSSLWEWALWSARMAKPLCISRLRPAAKFGVVSGASEKRRCRLELLERAPFRCKPGWRS